MYIYQAANWEQKLAGCAGAELHLVSVQLPHAQKDVAAQLVPDVDMIDVAASAQLRGEGLR